MVAHDFLVKNCERALKYKLYFDKHHPETIIFPAPSFFNLSAGPRIILWSAIQAYRNPAPASEPEPPRMSLYSWDPEAVASQWQSESSSSHYDPNYSSSQYDPSFIYRFWGLSQPLVPEPAPVPDPYQELVFQWEAQEFANQWNPQDPPEYRGEVYFEPWT